MTQTTYPCYIPVMTRDEQNEWRPVDIAALSALFIVLILMAGLILNEPIHIEYLDGPPKTLYRVHAR